MNYFIYTYILTKLVGYFLLLQNVIVTVKLNEILLLFRQMVKETRSCS